VQRGCLSCGNFSDPSAVLTALLKFANLCQEQEIKIFLTWQ
jgi:hypothetical protein